MHPLIDREKQIVAKRYHKDNRFVNVASFVVAAIFLAGVLLFDISEGLVNSLSGVIGARSLVIAAYFSIFYAAFSILTLPFTYVEGYVIEHKYGFSTQNRRQWFVDWVKSFLVTYVIGLVVFEIIYLVIPAAPALWWLWLSLIMIGFSVILANIFPVVILPLFYKSSPIEDGGLKKEIFELAARAGVGIKGVYSIDLSAKTTKANAAVAGLGGTKRILLGDTLLSKYQAAEVLSAVAHEMIHYRERYVWWLILWQSLITIFMFYVFFRIQPFVYAWFDFNNAAEIAAFPLFALTFGVLSYALGPLTSAISRHYERRADRGALGLTGNAGAFIRLIAQFCNEQLVIAYPNPVIEWYKYSHPSPGKRIAFAEKWQGP